MAHVYFVTEIVQSFDATGRRCFLKETTYIRDSLVEAAAIATWAASVPPCVDPAFRDTHKVFIEGCPSLPVADVGA